MVLVNNNKLIDIPTLPRYIPEGLKPITTR